VAAEASRLKQVTELESRLGNLEQRLIEKEEEFHSKESMLTQRHNTELNALRDSSERELTTCKRELGNEISMLRERLNALEQARSEAVAQLASVTAQAEADNRRFTSELREASQSREEAERRLKEAMELIEEAKVVDRRNAILDSRMTIEIERRRNLHEFVEDLKGKIRVYVRVRPLSDSERNRGSHDAYTKNHDSSLTYFQPDAKPPDDKKNYEFDKVFYIC
jgi:kinesin family member C1